MTEIIASLTVIISLLGFNNLRVNNALIFNPFVTQSRNEWYRFFTCSLLHADFFHLLVNMYVFYYFGRLVEYYYGQEFGSRGALMFVLLYVSSVITANISTFVKHRNNPSYNSLGASGGVSAIVFTGILFDPFLIVSLLPLYFIQFPQILFGVAYLAYSWWMSRRSGSDHVNHEAHFYGSLHGIIFTLVFKPDVGRLFLEQLYHLF